MPKAEEHLSKETLEQISTESFAQNISNYRSMLLKWEREVDEGRPAGPRANLMAKEAAMLQEIIGSQINRAGTNARSLGVPPEELFDIRDLYLRVFRKLVLHATQQMPDLYSPQFEAVINSVESIPEETRPDVFKRFVGHIQVARVAQGQLLQHPESASLVISSYFKAIDGMVAAFKEISPNWVANAAPPTPPQQPPPPPSRGGDGGGDIPRRVDRLESKVDKITDNLGKIKMKLGRMEERLMHTAGKADLVGAMEPIKTSLSQINERFAHVPTKFDLVKAAIAIPGATWFATKYGDPLMSAILGFFKG